MIVESTALSKVPKKSVVAAARVARVSSGDTVSLLSAVNVATQGVAYAPSPTAPLATSTAHQSTAPQALRR